MNGITEQTSFADSGTPIGFTMLDFWKYQFSNIYDLQDQIAEFLVGKALGLNEAQNRDGWTLYDMKYRNACIEVKETGYYHSWQEKYADGKISQQRSFGIHPAYSKYKNSSSDLARQNDIYVFCLNTGTTPEDSNPLELGNWEFYVIPTSVINSTCKPEQKTISLGRVRKMSRCLKYSELKSEIDSIISNMDKNISKLAM